MRYRDFKIAESIPNPDANDPRGPDQRNDPNAEAEGLQAGPPYPPEQVDDVKALQTRLEELGYSVGSTGIDGKYGPRTERAVAAFKRDNNVTPATGRNLDATASATLASATKVANPTPTGNEGGSIGDLGALADLDNLPEATEVVNDFLGSELEPDEMNMLLRAIASEASTNSQERAAVAAVILNRVRSGRYPNSLEAVLTQRNQFQAVTGTRYDPGPSDGFSYMSNTTAAQVVGALIRYLPNMDRSWLNFTSNNPKAYGRGTNINFMYAMRNARDSQVIGQTVFGTA